MDIPHCKAGITELAKTDTLAVMGRDSLVGGKGEEERKQRRKLSYFSEKWTSSLAAAIQISSEITRGDPRRRSRL